jgi:tetratricopeptide (TPR) repeat protein
MDVDYANSKGSYVITGTAEDMALATSNIITWDDYKKNDGELTFGLLSQISPDGRYVVSTVKDESVFVPRPPLAFSQLFFPVKGILCIYDRQKKTFSSLPGADDPNYVQSNATWSPDGKYIVFARTEAYKLKRDEGSKAVLLSAEECKEFLEEGKPFKFELYRVPFNDGAGGKAEPLEGASNNGMSNFFAKYSPDGKWIVFCKAADYMLLQPDSELFIIPAEGGEPRKLECNTNLMNSWHSFSPNGKWLAFTSKTYSPYTQLFLTHIDEEGRSTPPVVLSHFTQSDRAGNIPEFVNADPTAIRKIHEQFVDDLSYVRAANECLKAEDYEGVEKWCKKALAVNPKNPEAHHNLAVALASRDDFDEAVKHWLDAVEIKPDYVEAYYNLGLVMWRQNRAEEAIGYWSKLLEIKPDHAKANGNLGAVLLSAGKTDEAVTHLSKAIELDPNYAEAHYNLARAMFNTGKLNEALNHFAKVARLKPDDADAYYNIGVILAQAGKADEASKYFSRAVQLNPNHAGAHYNLGVALAGQGDLGQAMRHWLEATRIEPNDIRTLLSLTAGYAKAGQFDRAIATAQRALVLARRVGDEKLAKQLEQSIETYKQAGRGQM